MARQQVAGCVPESSANTGIDTKHDHCSWQFIRPRHFAKTTFALPPRTGSRQMRSIAIDLAFANELALPTSQAGGTSGFRFSFLRYIPGLLSRMSLRSAHFGAKAFIVI